MIGGGDVCKDRLLPDLLRAFAEGRPAEIRNPTAVRPWQHVLDCLNGYVLLSQALLAGEGLGAWNFGPGPEAFVTVGEVAGLAAGLWGDGASWQTDGGDHPHEAELLALDATRARTELGWDDRLTFTEAVTWTVEWEAATRGRRRSTGPDARADQGVPDRRPVGIVSRYLPTASGPAASSTGSTNTTNAGPTERQSTCT